MNETIEIDVFKKRLAETIAWCTNRAKLDPAYDLRSTDLRPPSVWISMKLNLQLHDVVEAIAAERTRLGDPAKFDGLAGGRLLICTGATESVCADDVTDESKGFYDEDDMPPWDTWLCYLSTIRAGDGATQHQSEYLVSWVPPTHLERAHYGVEWHFMGCMRWAEDEDTPFTRQLRAAKLLIDV